MLSICSSILLATLSPLVVAIFGLIIPVKKRLLLEIFTTIGCLFCFVFMLYSALIFFTGGYFSFSLFNIMPRLAIAWKIDLAGIVFALSVSFLWMCTVFYAITYMKDWEDVRSFFSLIAVTIFSTFLAAFAANMITLFVAYELMTIATYPLVRYNKTDEANKSAKVYLFTLLSTSMALLMPAIIYLYNLNPTILDFHASINSTITIQNNELLILLLCMLYGSAKAALFPVHFWLPMAMVAPMPVSALLHAVAVVKMGVFVIIRMVFFVLNVVNNQTQEPFYVLTYISIASMIYASVYALQENVIKKRLAYSTIAQLAYISMVTSLRTKQAFIAAMFHMVAHAFAKITLFFCTGVIYKNTGKTTVTGMRGTARVMPFTMTCFTIAAASIIGLPPTIGFVSKYLILQAFGQELTTLLVCVLSVGSLFSLLYLAPIVLQSLKKARSDKALPIKENCSWALFAIFLTTLIVLVCIAIPVDKIFLR